MNRPIASTATSCALKPKALINLLEHRLTSESSPLVSLAMTLPAGSKFGVSERDCGEIAAAYKHAILQSTREESRISLARKADLRPSPLSCTLTPDHLILQSSFHVNYLPEMISTFKGLFSGRGSQGMGLGEFEVEGDVMEGVKLDGKIAYEDVRVVLTEAANRVAFNANNLYFPQGSQLINVKSLDTFHSQTISRAATSHLCSFVLSVNDSKLIDKKQLIEHVTANDFTVSDTVKNAVLNSQSTLGHELRIETLGNNVDFLLAFPVANGGFTQSASEVPLLIESLLKKSFPSASVQSSVTSDTSLVTLHFTFSADKPVLEIRDELKRVIESVKAIPNSVKDEDLIRAQERAKFTQALALDSRSTRLLLNSQHFALTGKLLSANSSMDLTQFKAALKECLQESQPVLIGRGNYKKLPYYQQLF